MEDFQLKINLMKQKIDNIKSDIETIKVESSQGNITPQKHIKQIPKQISTNKNKEMYNDNVYESNQKDLYQKIPKANTLYTPYRLKQNNTAQNNFNYNFNYNLENYSTRHKNGTPNLNYFSNTSARTSIKSNSNHQTMHNSFRMNNNTPNNQNVNTLNIHKRNKTIDQKAINTIKPNITNRNKILSSTRYSMNYENIVNELVDITNEFSEEEINQSMIVEIYKKTLREIKIKNEFINQLVELYNTKNGSQMDANSNEALISLWKWIKGMLNKRNVDSGYQSSYIKKPIEETNPYQLFCEKIMKEYNIKSLKELSVFVEKLLKKANKNDTFLEGIKKILMTEHKIEEY